MCPPTGILPTPNPRSSPGSIPSCVPKDNLSQAAYQKAHQSLHPSILNHSIRVYIYAKTLSENLPSSTWHQPSRLPLLFLACLFHDMGTSHAHDGPQRFEVEGADAASNFLSTHSEDGNFSAADAHEVWTAIALHTSPGIAERISALARIVREAVLIDFHRGKEEMKAIVDDAAVGEVEGEFPRLEIEVVLGDAVVEQAVRNPGKAPRSTWPGGLYRFKVENPGEDGVNGAF